MAHKSDQRLFLEFMGTGVLGALITGSVVWLNAHYFGTSLAAAKTVAALICLVVLYVVRSRYVFNDCAGPAVPAAVQWA